MANLTFLHGLTLGLIAGMLAERLGARWRRNRPFNAAADDTTAVWVEATSIGVAVIFRCSRWPFISL